MADDDGPKPAPSAAAADCSSRAEGSSSTCSPRAREDIEETDGLWLEREPGIFERADWDARARTLILSVRGGDEAATMELHWLSPAEWNALIEEAGFEVEALYGWFDRRPWEGGEDQIWVCRRPALTPDAGQPPSSRSHPARHLRAARHGPRRAPRRLEHLGVDAKARLAVDRSRASRSARAARRGRGRPCRGSPTGRRSAASARRRAAWPRRPERDGSATPPRRARSRPVELEEHPEAAPSPSISPSDARETRVAGRASVAQAPSSRSTSVSERPTRSENASAHGPSTRVPADERP